MSEQPTPSALILQMGKLRLEQEGPDPKPPSQLPGSQHSGPVLWTPSPVLLALCGLAHTCSLQLDTRALGTSGRGLPVPLPSPRRQKKIVGLEVSERAVFRSSLSGLGTGGCLQLRPRARKTSSQGRLPAPTLTLQWGSQLLGTQAGGGGGIGASLGIRPRAAEWQDPSDT